MADESNTKARELFDGTEYAEGTELESALAPLDRPRGILSKADREYLCGLKDYAHAQSEANRRQDIRDRVINGLKDFTILWLLLDPDERSNIFDEMGEDEVNHCIESMITFGFLGIDQDRPRFEERIEHGVLLGANYDTAGRWAGEATDVDVSIDIDYQPDVDALYDQFQEENADQLTPAEIGVLVRAGKILPEDLDELEDPEGPTLPTVYAFNESNDDK